MPAILQRFDVSHGGRGARTLVYALLVLVMGASIALSVVMERIAGAIGRNAVPLLNQTIPQLRLLQDFESALLRYQLALDKRYSDAITPARFTELESLGRTELDQQLDQLR